MGKEPGKKKVAQSGGSVWCYRRRLCHVGMTLIMVGTVREGRKFFLPLVGQLRGYPINEVGAVTSLTFAMDLVMTPVAGYLLTKFGKLETVALALSIAGLGIFILCSVDARWAYVFSAVFSGLGYGMATGCVVALSCDYAPDDCRPEFLGMCRTISKFSDVFIPSFFGMLLQVMTPTSCGFLLLGVAVTNAFATCARSSLLRKEEGHGACAASAGGAKQEGRGSLLAAAAPCDQPSGGTIELQAMSSGPVAPPAA